MKSKLIGLALSVFAATAHANTNPPVDCNCLASLPALHTTCPGVVPDLSLLAINCFSASVDTNQLGFFGQTPPAGTWLGLGTNTILVTVFDTNFNSIQCSLAFVVTAPPATNLTFSCPTNKTVECGTAWQFDAPVAFSTCCDPGVTVTNVSTVTNGTCPKVITKYWSASDLCGNTASCSQTITVVDSTPPVALCSGANLVPNPGFESLAYCPSSFSQLDAAFPWFQPTVATPDCFNACTSPGDFVSVPNNIFGFQNAFSGQGYAGAYVYGPVNINNPGGAPYREYIETPLLAPLIAGLTYKVTFHVSLADISGKAIAEIGAYLSAGPVPVGGVGTGVIPVVPQVVNPSGNLLNSTSSWMLVQGTFVAAGGEDHLTLGNFLTDPNTTSVSLPSPPQYSYYGYYYYDDVSVAAVCPGQVTIKFAACGAPVIFDPPTGFDLCSGTNVAVTVASTVTNGLCPPTITRNWTLTDLCGNTSVWSQAVTIVDTNPPVLFCPTNNLVPNGQFEAYTNCPNYYSQLATAVPWFPATAATPDYFNTCAAPASFVSVPVNFVGNQSPLSGQGYAGAFAYSQNGIANTNAIYREYIEVPLITPLIAGKSYSVSFYVSLAEESGQAIAELGAHFSVGPVTDFGSVGVLPVIPQVINPSLNLLTSTNSWMLVSGTFTAAGGEDHLTLGNFRSDANTTAVPASGSLTTYAYYYYDDVSVVPLCGELVPNKAVPCGMPWGFDQPSSFDACSGTNVAVTVVGTTANTCAAFFTRTWSFTDLCGNATNWTQAVTIVDPTPLTINCACLSEVAANLLYTNGCTGIVPNLLQFNSCFSTNCRPITRTQTPPPGTIVGGGIHPITVSVVDCSGNSNGCVLPFTVNGAAPVISCPADIVLFTCQPGAAAWFTPVAFGNVGPVICSPPSGSLFPLNTSTLVTCTATNGCGVSATCTFAVTVMTPPTKWPCYTVIVIGIPITPMGTAIVRYLPPLPGGGLGVDFDNLGSSGQDGVRFDLGAAQKFTFSTALDFNAPAGASFDLALPDVNGGPSTPLLTFTRSCQPHCGWNLQASQRLVADTSASYRSIAIGANGELFSSFTQDAAALDANVLASITSMAGATSAVMTVTLDCRTREVTLDFPLGAWTPDAARKGWDGCIYGNGPRGSTTNKNARLILTPLTTIPTPPITTLALLASNLTSMAFDNPAITAMGRKWGDGHVTLMKAYDDGTEQGMEFASFGDGGGVTTDLGHSASFQFRIGHFENGDLPTEEQFYSIRAWPPGPLTNRPAPPPINLRLTHGSTGVACAADFAGIGVSNVTLQLWNGTTLLSEKAHVAATLETPLTTLSTLPTILGCPGLGVLSLSHTNPFTVYSGLDCPAAGCPPGTELRIIPEFPTGHLAPAVFTELQCQASNGTDNLLYHLQRTLDCTPGPLNVVRASNGITLTWPDDGFRLQGAETVNGPWYDLGVSSPVTLPANSNLRAFRLLCD